MKRMFGPLLLTIAALLFVVASAMAVDGPPRLLILTGKISELKAEGKLGEKLFVLETEGKKSIGCGAGEGTETFKEEEGKALDAILGTNTIHLTSCKEGEISCRSETSTGEKDPVGIVLFVYDVHFAAEVTSGGVLEMLKFLTLLPAAGTGNLVINCGGVKVEAKGSMACLVTPALVNVPAGNNVETLCKEAGGKQETGTCNETKEDCEKFAKDPLLTTLGGKGFEKTALVFHFLETFNDDVFLDD